MKKVSYDKYEEYSATFSAGFNDLEERLARREAMAVKLADLLNAKIDECEALKAELWRFEAALDRILSNIVQYTEQLLEKLLIILSNCSDEDLVIDITSEALYGDR